MAANAKHRSQRRDEPHKARRHGLEATRGRRAPYPYRARVEASRCAALQGKMDMWKPTLRQLETIASMASMPSERIASAIGIRAEVFAAWLSRLAAANALSQEDADRLLYPQAPRAVQPPPPPPRDPRIVAERIFEAAAE